LKTEIVTDKPFTMDELAAVMRDRNFFADLLKEAVSKKKTLQNQLDQATQEEATAYQKLAEFEKQVKMMCKNLK
jgi:uncharacterized protein (DUF3084 family)